MKTNKSMKKTEKTNLTPGDLEIGICISYEKTIYTLATVIFKHKGDVVLCQPYKDYFKLSSEKKFDPHVTYHGKEGVHHFVSYGNHMYRKNKQKINKQFSGMENLIHQGFGRDYAKKLGQMCNESHEHILINSSLIKDKVDLIQDQLGEIRTQLPTASFQVEMIEPDRYDLVKEVLKSSQRIIKKKLFTNSFPWCLIVVNDNY